MRTTTPATTSLAGPKKRTKGESNSPAVPVFLRKTYKMIDTSDSSVATWADGGTTFVVKDIEKFQAEIIPEFFKHNNFSSFVRQLNFYGFRKIKSDPLRIRDAEISEESKYWKFRHEKFQQGREDLLVEIRKSNNNDNTEKQEIDMLRQEVATLKDELGSVRAEMQQMMEIIERFQEHHSNQKMEQAIVTSQAPQCGKKRKIGGTPSPITSQNEVQAVFSASVYDPIPTRPIPVSVQSKNDRTKETDTNKGDHSRVDPSTLSLFTKQDEAMLASLFSQDIDELTAEEARPDRSASLNVDRNSEAVEKVCQVLSILPKEIQDAFAGRLVAVMSDPDSLRLQADALSSLARVSTEPLGDGSSVKNSPCTAAAVLEAYLTQKVDADILVDVNPGV